mmetsp:Transcript_9274/g.16867  ORF Transcript_9274/g.16867 Transcript_9274/m.16867 type:complete len:719 (-) Transcript_9274:5-2161(-)
MEDLGPQPLLRHDSDGRLQLQQKGLALLRKAGAPVHVVFAIGGSRCGKSTAGNALIFGLDSSGCRAGFETGSSFDPVTNGIDVAVKPLPGGGALVVADCEGAFHICGSSQSARGFGSLGVLAYHLSSTVLHVSMGSIDERDIEVLGHLAASAGLRIEDSSDLPDPTDDSATQARAALSPPLVAPSLLLLVNAARFDLGDAVARRLLRPPNEGKPAAARGCARAAIARGFRGQPALEALPACDHEAYWPKVEALRKRLLESSPVVLQSGLQASGSDLALRIAELVSHLNGEAPSLAALREPEPASEAVLRQAHLEPLVEEISRRFAATGAAVASDGASTAASTPPPPRVAWKADGELTSPGRKSAIEEALAEFDCRSAWLTSGDVEGIGESVAIRQELVQEVRQRLAVRLTGINEAVARGRHQALTRPRRRPSFGGDSDAGTVAPSPGTEKENRTPTPPSTPSGKRRSLRVMQASTEEAELRLERLQAGAAEQVAELQAAFAAAKEQAVQLAQETDGEREAAAAVMSLKDDWKQRLQKEGSERATSSAAQAADSSAAVAALREELRDLEELMPDVGAFASELHELRAALEELQLRRREKADSAGRALDLRTQNLREAWDGEVKCFELFGQRMSSHILEETEALLASLEDERLQRKDRHQALAEVVDRYTLWATSLEEADDSLEVPSKQHPSEALRPLASTPAMPRRWLSQQQQQQQQRQ